MTFTKSTPDTFLPSYTWFICKRMNKRLMLRYERMTALIDDKIQTFNTWWDLDGNCYLDSEDWAPIYYLNDLKDEQS